MTPLLDQLVFIDTSAVIALDDPREQFHSDAQQFFKATRGVVWVSLNSTSQETYTFARYHYGIDTALHLYDWLRGEDFQHITFNTHDECQARKYLSKYADQDLSFHDALLAAVMLKVGAYRVFAFDHHFWTFGFEVVPGRTA